ncbi:MAG: bacillithiol system redox-active protein YtxJ [Ferruginibacter sp.]
MNWINLISEDQLEMLKESSNLKPQLIFKHSSRCVVSSIAKGRLERTIQPDDIDFYYLDLVHYRALSNKVAEVFKVNHESPQVLLIKNGTCIYDESHSGIQMNEIIEQAQ